MNTNANMSVESPSEGLFCPTLNAGAGKICVVMGYLWDATS
jgi:hypothetical protein